MVKPPPIGEKAWQSTLVSTLEAFGYEVNHNYPLRTKHGWRTGSTAKGWPDLTALRGSWLLAIEVKDDATPFQEGQIEWLARFALLRCARALVLRPRDDWPTIVEWIRRPHTAPLCYGVPLDELDELDPRLAVDLRRRLDAANVEGARRDHPREGNQP